MAKAAPSSCIGSPRCPQNMRDIGPSTIWHTCVTTCKYQYKNYEYILTFNLTLKTEKGHLDLCPFFKNDFRSRQS